MKRLTRILTEPVLSWPDAAVFAFLSLVAYQYHWGWPLQVLVFFGLGLVFAIEHDWFRWRAARRQRKERAS